jgi:hypothetical protein
MNEKKHRFEMNDKVIIKKNNLRGTVIDIWEYPDGIVYTVESDTIGLRDDADYNIPWPEYECREEDLEPAVDICMSAK